jgi:hypothetical protein
MLCTAQYGALRPAEELLMLRDDPTENAYQVIKIYRPHNFWLVDDK